MSFWKNFKVGAGKTAKVAGPIVCSGFFGAYAGAWFSYIADTNEWANGYNEACRDHNLSCSATSSIDPGASAGHMLWTVVVAACSAGVITGVISAIGGVAYAARKATSQSSETESPMLSV